MNEKEITINKIKTALQNNNLEEGIAVCRNYLEWNNDGEILSYLRKLEEEKRVIDQKIISEALEKAKPLWQAGDYLKIYKLLSRLKKIDPKNKAIEAEFLKLQQASIQEQENQAESFSEAAKEEINNLKKTNNYEEIIRVCEKILDLNPSDKFALQEIEKAKENIINTELEKIEKEGDIKMAMKKLRLLAENFGFPKIILKKMQELDQKLVANAKLAQQKNIDEVIVKIKDLLKRKEYFDAHILCLKILDFDNQNAEARKLIKQIDAKIGAKREEKILTLLKEKNTKLKEEYSKNPDSFLVI